MERVAFIVEETGERIPCMLNPESVVLRRRAGLSPRRISEGPVVTADRPNDPLVFTGGGCTELTLNLLFDTTLPSPTPLPEDVRALTAPLWRAAQGASGGAGGGRAPALRFFWGKWNMLGAISALAERLEYFTASGQARRSWLRLRLLELAEDTAGAGHQLASGLEPGVPAESAAPLRSPTGWAPSVLTETGGEGRRGVADELAGARSAPSDYLAELLQADVPLDALGRPPWI
ncbi:MAG: hypothetical protein IPM60_03425 [Rhodospirillales bacterium]|nr:hypothetical protein [Rhodospirillales bacterium]